MSYILDALKKDKNNNSSKEHDNIPDLSSEHAIYELEEEKPLSRWLWPLVVMVLVLTIFVLLFMLFNPSSQQFAQYLKQQPLQQQNVDNRESSESLSEKNEALPETKLENTEQAVDKNSMVVSKPLEVASPVVQRVEKKVVARPPGSSYSSPPRSTQNKGTASSSGLTKADLPSLIYTTHIYATLPKDRFVMLNGRPYAQGDRIDDNLYVKEILENDLVVTYKGKEFVLPSLEDVNVSSP
ncbi:general secretion pathway protein GspB [Kangiella sediminilitoris]|uniref:Type II secretion system protein GspB C-terminal domain-containing protein n=1 Tax=Kangiella sediminilitoris TaxID=1144748 RepID=A0A1B3B8M7_9GAMM|nr:general secretion pathway protein GspB [Kangiella sediminilitoris]AOE49158.1 hypothetical protein KS2013_434 [Kangiella sediminilitoris]